MRAPPIPARLRVVGHAIGRTAVAPVPNRSCSGRPAQAAAPPQAAPTHSPRLWRPLTGARSVYARQVLQAALGVVRRAQSLRRLILSSTELIAEAARHQDELESAAAATRLQSVVRGRAARQRVAVLRAPRDEVKERVRAAASRLQAASRARVARDFVAQLLREKAAREATAAARATKAAGIKSSRLGFLTGRAGASNGPLGLATGRQPTPEVDGEPYQCLRTARVATEPEAEIVKESDELRAEARLAQLVRMVEAVLAARDPQPWVQKPPLHFVAQPHKALDALPDWEAQPLPPQGQVGGGDKSDELVVSLRGECVG